MNPVIFLWAHPRSMSTAIERIMRERGDLECLHEPFLHYYYLHRSSKPLPHFDSEQALSWDDSSTPGDWQYVEGWHQSVSASRGIRAQAPRDAQRVAEEFAQLCREAPQLEQYLQHHLPFYQQLREHSLDHA